MGPGSFNGRLDCLRHAPRRRRSRRCSDDHHRRPDPKRWGRWHNKGRRRRRPEQRLQAKRELHDTAVVVERSLASLSPKQPVLVGSFDSSQQVMADQWFDGRWMMQGRQDRQHWQMDSAMWCSQKMRETTVESVRVLRSSCVSGFLIGRSVIPRMAENVNARCPLQSCRQCKESFIFQFLTTLG